MTQWTSADNVIYIKIGEVRIGANSYLGKSNGHPRIMYFFIKIGKIRIGANSYQCYGGLLRFMVVETDSS